MFAFATLLSVAFGESGLEEVDPFPSGDAGISAIRFYLWTGNNKWTDGKNHGAEEFTAYDVTGSKHFDVTKKTKFLIHGYTNNAFSYSEQMVKNYLKNDNYNIIAMDWAELAGVVLFPIWDAYSTAASNVVPAAGSANTFINGWMNHYKLKPNDTHIVGHSLGAQVAAQVGRNVHATTGTPVGRITGLDPAGPLFVDGNLKQYCLKKTDAAFVDVIHTDGSTAPEGYLGVMGGYFGNLNPMGHLDFFPNGGGVVNQPGCWAFMNAIAAGACDHGRSVSYFAESIDEGGKGFPAKACDTMNDCEYGHTTGGDVIHMGEYAMSQAPAGAFKGQSYRYYLKTNAQSPYSISDSTSLASRLNQKFD